MLAAGGVKGAMLALMVELRAEIYNARIEALLSAMLQDENVRLPGYRRHDLAHRAEQEDLEVSEVTMQKLEKSPLKAEFCQLGGGTVTSGPHLGNNASAKAPFGGECKNLRVEFERLRNSVRREAPL
jgi:LDH2 family malate/lactate/ureidoglycolate dehydrogenase